MDSPGTQVLTPSTKPKKGLCVFLCEFSNDENDTTDTSSNVPQDPDWLWWCYFREYMDFIGKIPDG